MKKFINKVIGKIEMFFMNLMIATKNTEQQILKQGGVGSVNGGINICQDVNQGAHELSRALLRGELTEDVKQLRYRTYKVDREAKKYKYYAPTLALKKKEGKDNKFVSYDNSDGLDVITIQYNSVVGEDIKDAINQIESGGRGKQTEYTFQIERSFRPRFRVEEFLKKVVVKRFDETHAILDFYFSKYPERFFNNSNDKSFRSKAFIHEIENIRDNNIKSDMLEMEKMRFVTSHAYKQEDLIEYVFRNLWFKEVVEFDGDYILRFKASIEHDGIDLTKPFYNETMERKYQNKEKKDLTIDLSESVTVQTYTCADCGKIVTFDVNKMDEMPISEAREIDEEVDDDNSWNVTEYMDLQIVNETIGKMLCKKCLKKYLDNRGLEVK